MNDNSMANDRMIDVALLRYRSVQCHQFAQSAKSDEAAAELESLAGKYEQDADRLEAETRQIWPRQSNMATWLGRGAASIYLTPDEPETPARGAGVCARRI